MFSATLQLLLLSLPFAFPQATKIINGCVPGCRCPSPTADNPRYRVICPKLPESPIPSKITEVKSGSCPPYLTDYDLRKMKPGSVQTFDLSNNGIKGIADETFKEFKQMKVLDLSHNQLTNIPSKMLLDCESLQELRLSHNAIKTMGANCVRLTFELQKLFLDNNELSEIPKLPRNLEELDVSSNRIQKVNNQDFGPLHKINLCRNPIQQWENVIFSHLTDITMSTILPIDFGHLAIERIRLDNVPDPNSNIDLTTLQNVPGLTDLEIDGFTINAFKWAPNVGKKIKRLKLNHVTFPQTAQNEFLDNLPATTEEIDVSGSPGAATILLKNSQALEKLPELSVVKMRDCKLESLEGLQMSKKLAFDIAENPINCDCAFETSIRDVIIMESNDTCASPPALARSKIMDVVGTLCTTKTKEIATRDDALPNLEGKLDLPPVETEKPAETITDSFMQPTEPPEVITADKKKPIEDKTELPKEEAELHGEKTPEKDHQSGEGASQKTGIIVGVVVAVAFVAAIIFSTLFFYFRRRGHSDIGAGTAEYSKSTSSRDNLVKGGQK